MSAYLEHRASVEAIQRRLREFTPSSCPSSPMRSHMMRKKNYQSLVDELQIKRLNAALEFNQQEKFIVVEPGITMEQLLCLTLPYGLMPPVVPEFKGITVGGAVNGAAIESSSHHYGQFNDICLAYEVLTADGRLILASKEENSDLFEAFAGSYGTLGFLVSVKIALVPVNPWIKLTYETMNSPEEALDFMERLNTEFMEAIVFKNKTVVIYGKSIEDKEAKKFPVKRFDRYNDDWFYSHADKTSNAAAYVEEVSRIQDYLFRHDRGAFWMGGYGLHLPMLLRYFIHKGCTFAGISDKAKWLVPQYCLPKNPNLLFRSLFGKLMKSSTLYDSLHHQSEGWFQKYFVIQDFYLPKEGGKKFIRSILTNQQILPLWICPVKATQKKQLLSPHYDSKEKMLFDVGVYGIPVDSNAEETVRILENLTHQLEGRKMFYCTTYLSADNFWKLYPESAYRELRRKYSAESLPDITEKVLS